MGAALAKALPGGLVGLTLVLIVWLITFAVTTLSRGDDESRGRGHPPKR